MLVGLAGAGLLFAPQSGLGSIDKNLLNGFLLLQLGMAAWAFGSIYMRRNSGPTHPIIAGGVQQLAAGLILAPFAFFIHEHPIAWVSAVWRR
jgi:drug/metabolite transporter (DMT)-like permease